MKKIIIIISLLINIQNNYTSDCLNIGDNIVSIFNENIPKYKTEGIKIINIEEGKVDFYKYKIETTDNDIKYLVILDKYIIGVLQNNNGNNEFIFDMNGDGILDTIFNKMVIPYWVVKENNISNISRHNNIQIWLDNAFTNFNSTENPYSSGNHIQLLKNILFEIENGNIENKDILYSIYFYYYMGNKYPWIALQTLLFIKDAYLNRFDKLHPIIYLFEIETYINLNRIEEAKAVLNTLLEIAPEFVPGYVYRWQLENNPKKKREYYIFLKEKYPNHWITVQI